MFRDPISLMLMAVIVYTVTAMTAPPYIGTYMILWPCLILVWMFQSLAGGYVAIGALIVIPLLIMGSGMWATRKSGR